ncbi:aldehyde dehydrogenase family protein [Actinoallomurus sp. NBC_01490]|uniref:aldehyde dehydrogenase family protein n=1 Tax=Actinoallomurus sp. NBC_01490 TaxID=2903557 RepID=UPI002E321D1E|nr:aldehyde dehydrogenase family protein [Actinoallomurus sp. NBC_01490]
MSDEDVGPGCFINGRLTPGNGAVLDVRSPWNGELVDRISTASATDVARAVSAAEEAFLDWREAPTPRRVAVLTALAALLDDHAQELAVLQVRENGKALNVRNAQRYGDHLRYSAHLLQMPSGYVVEPPAGSMRVHTERVPIGVVACLTPWNSPINLLLWKLGPAIAMANTVVVKPSEVTPLSTLRLAELATKAGLPPGVLNVVSGDAAVGRALVEHPSVARIAFTGSSATGEQVAVAAARGLRPVSLELGGKSANVVFGDADLEQAVRGAANGAFGAAGQACMAGSRILVERSVYDEVLHGLVAAADAIRIGNPLDPSVDMGPIASAAQLQKIETMVDEAVAGGACVAAGGRREYVAELPEGFFYRPTVLTDVTPDSRIFHEEVFGPVVCVIPFESEDEAVRLANSTRYGLAAGVWTTDRRRSDRVASRLIAGTVWVNTYRKLAHNVPFGGMGMSGLGRENGPGCLDEFSEQKAVWVDLGSDVRDVSGLRRTGRAIHHE